MNHHRHLSRSVGVLLPLAFLAAPLLLGGCKREKPNANRDLRENQQRLMDSMDKIAADLEAEQQAKADLAAAPEGTPGPEPEPAPASSDKN